MRRKAREKENMVDLIDRSAKIVLGSSIYAQCNVSECPGMSFAIHPVCALCHVGQYVVNADDASAGRHGRFGTIWR